MAAVIALMIGLAAGAIIAWFIIAERAKGTLASRMAELEIQNAKKEAQLEEVRKSLEGQKKLLDDMEKRLSDTFKALASDALRNNSQAIAELARSTLETALSEAKGDFGKRQEAIDGIVKPLQETLKRYEEHVKSLEESRQKAYGSLEEQNRSIGAFLQQLQKETGNLVSALRTPQVRGRWGEITLKRAIEFAGMSPWCDFTEQKGVDSEKGTLRPDVIVHMPGERDIVVDAKTPLDAYLDAISADSKEARAEALTRHARQTRAHMKNLADKSYWAQFPKSPDLVVMFIPVESSVVAAFEHDKTLFEDGIAKRVFLVGPGSLIALLMTIASLRREEQIARNAQAISDLGRALYDRISTLSEYFSDLGKNLTKANEAYNAAIGSLESRVLVSARRFKELGAATGAEIPLLEPVETRARDINLPDVQADRPDA